MPLSTSLHKALKELLTDKEHDGKKLIDIIAEINDKAEAKDKVQKANEDISSERDTLKEEVKTLKAKVAESETAIKTKETELENLKANQLSPEEKKLWLETKAKGMTPEIEAKMNRMADDMAKLTETVKQQTQKAEEADKRAKDAKMSTSRTGLENKLTKILAEKKITGANAEIALALMEKNGLFKLVEKDGEFSEEFYTKNENGGMLSANINELADYVATKHENLVDSSGRSGPGQTHRSDPTKNSGNDYGSLMETKQAARSLMEADFTKK